MTSSTISTNASEKEQMLQWIASKGSDSLRVAAGKGYEIKGMYLRERINAEMPGFDYDPHCTAYDKDENSKRHMRETYHLRANPSPEGLWHLEQAEELCGQLDVEVQLMYSTKEISDQQRAEEVVVIYPYLGKYLLYKPVKIDNTVLRILHSLDDLQKIPLNKKEDTVDMFNSLVADEPQMRMRAVLQQAAKECPAIAEQDQLMYPAFILGKALDTAADPGLIPYSVSDFLSSYMDNYQKNSLQLAAQQMERLCNSKI